LFVFLFTLVTLLLSSQFFNYKDLNLVQGIIVKDHHFVGCCHTLIFNNGKGGGGVSTTNLLALQIWRDLQVCGQFSLTNKEHYILLELDQTKYCCVDVVLYKAKVKFFFKFA